MPGLNCIPDDRTRLPQGPSLVAQEIKNIETLRAVRNHHWALIESGGAHLSEPTAKAELEASLDHVLDALDACERRLLAAKAVSEADLLLKLQYLLSVLSESESMDATLGRIACSDVMNYFLSRREKSSDKS